MSKFHKGKDKFIYNLVNLYLIEKDYPRWYHVPGYLHRILGGMTPNLGTYSILIGSEILEPRTYLASFNSHLRAYLTMPCE